MLSKYAQHPLVGVVVVTHDTSCSALIGAARAILGDLPAAVPVGVGVGESLEAVVASVSKACAQVEAGAGVLLLVDVHGATPFQACLAMLDGTRPAEVLCGVNLPMLLKLGTIDRREFRPEELAEMLREAGRRSIRLGSELSGKVVLGT